MRDRSEKAHCLLHFIILRLDAWREDNVSILTRPFHPRKEKIGTASDKMWTMHLTLDLKMHDQRLFLCLALFKLVEKAKEYAGKLDVATFTASAGWLDRFKSCHGIVRKSICGESAAV
ncbi:tigger transposable element-derived protein 4-like isoform [Elysia marginata]|uniref:Tigger transposable element-derived protein 4-like isoform n=1 Tax=Elysia marginata TaxID=1093978 RepID=A0AAV4H1D7_9GAST|nr:tigger transposable element-derived protein 4-like isoform [Elysia marginata]